MLIPFNEPDWIWYGPSGSQLTSFENDWKTVYQKIRSLWPAAQIAGPSFVNKVSGKALDVYNNSTANGGTVDQWTYSGGNNQLWSVS